ncbi:MAG: hypothetical protein ACFE0Q_00500 [Anaerolineae bacterium]
MRKNVTLEPDWGADFGQPPKFEIQEVKVCETSVYVSGIAHSAIKVGDRFRMVQALIPETNTLMIINLRVRAIKAYHNILNRLNAHMVAELELTGDSTSLLALLKQQGWVVTAPNQHQHDEGLNPLVLTK